MSKKPRPTRTLPDGTVVPNPYATAAGGALLVGNAQHRDYAIAALLDDIERGERAVGRYVRVRDAIAKHFNCSRGSAEDAIRDARVALAERFAAELPSRVAEICSQLQRIADEQERDQPQASVAALREQAKILGLYAPKRLEVTHGASPELALQLDAIIEVLNDEELAAMRVVLAGIERAKREGRLALPAAEAVEDAEIVEPESGEN
jgi:hypothetical protein